MSLAQRVSEVPDANEHGNLSTARLLADAGYLETPQSLTVGDVEAALEEDPNLAELWLERGRDQRLAGGWGIGVLSRPSTITGCRTIPAGNTSWSRTGSMPALNSLSAMSALSMRS
jgi:hypothetical protein